jgi:hypothetical protein
VPRGTDREDAAIALGINWNGEMGRFGPGSMGQVALPGSPDRT